MALINCQNCGKQISDKSINCIHCGGSQRSSSTMNKLELYKKLPKIVIIGLILLLILGFIFLYATSYIAPKGV